MQGAHYLVAAWIAIGLLSAVTARARGPRIGPFYSALITIGLVDIAVAAGYAGHMYAWAGTTPLMSLAAALLASSCSTALYRIFMRNNCRVPSPSCVIDGNST